MKHPKCFANQFGNCCEKISAEHYISESVLERIGLVNQVTGLSWIRPGEARPIGNASLVSKILCADHNSELSPLDAEAGRFFSLLLDFHNEIVEGTQTSRMETISGPMIERWFLKVICGLKASGGWPASPNPPEKLLKILFGHEAFSDKAGLYCFRKDDNIGGHVFEAVTQSNQRGQMCAVKFRITGLTFLFLMDPAFSFPDIEYSLRRPAALTFTDKRQSKTLVLDWGNRELGTELVFEYVRTETMDC